MEIPLQVASAEGRVSGLLGGRAPSPLRPVSPTLVPGRLSSSQLQAPGRNGVFSQRWLQKSHGRHWVTCRADGSPEGIKVLLRLLVKGRGQWLRGSGARVWRFRQSPAAAGSGAGGRQTWDWGFPPLSAGSSLARGLGTRRRAVRRERGSSTWVLHADGHLTWSQDFDTMNLLRDGAARRPALADVPTAPHKGSDVGIEQARALCATS